LELPAIRYRLSLNRIKNGSKWRIAKSAWAGLKAGEEVYLVATPVLESSQDDKKPKDEPKPKTSPRRPTSPRNQPISPRSLSNSSSGNRSLSTEDNGAQAQDVVVPATPSNTDVSDSEDEVVELGKEKPSTSSGNGSERTESSQETGCASKKDRIEDSAAQSVENEAPPSPQLNSIQHPSSSAFPPSAQPLPPSTSQHSTTTTDSHDSFQARRSTSPSPSLASEHSPRYKTQLLARGILHNPAPILSNPSPSPSTFIKPPPSSIESTSALANPDSTPRPSTSASLPTPAQQPQNIPVATEPTSSQPSDDSNTSWRIGIDSTGQVNFVAASSPQITSQPLPPNERTGNVTSNVEDTLSQMSDVERRRIEKGKGRADDPSPRMNSEEEEEEEEEDRPPSHVKQELRSSPWRSSLSRTSRRIPGSNRANSGSPGQDLVVKSSGSSRSSFSPKHSSFVLEIIPSPKKRRPACLLAPRKRRRTENTASTSNNSAADASTASSSSNSPSSLLPIDLQSPRPSSSSRPQASQTQPIPTQRVSKSLASQRPRPRSSLASAQRRAQDDAAALARPRCEIPPFPSSGRFCLHLRLPNAPVAPRWADAKLKPIFLLRYQASGTLGNVLSKVFEYIASETLWNVRDLRLRYTDANEDDPREREKVAWGFDTILTDFQNLEEWGVNEQDWLDVDYIPFSPYRTWQDTE